MPKSLESSNFEQLLKHILRVFPSFGGDKFNFVGLDHSGSQSYILIAMYPSDESSTSIKTKTSPFFQLSSSDVTNIARDSCSSYPPIRFIRGRRRFSGMTVT